MPKKIKGNCKKSKSGRHHWIYGPGHLKECLYCDKKIPKNRLEI